MTKNRHGPCKAPPWAGQTLHYGLLHCNGPTDTGTAIGLQPLVRPGQGLPCRRGSLPEG